MIQLASTVPPIPPQPLRNTDGSPPNGNSSAANGQAITTPLRVVRPVQLRPLTPFGSRS